MECLADAVEARFLIAAPRDLKESVLKAAARPEVRLEHGTRKLSKKAQLFFYSLKVGTAVAGALLLLAAAPDIAGRVQAPVPSHREYLMQESLWNIKKPMTDCPAASGSFPMIFSKMEVTDHDPKTQFIPVVSGISDSRCRGNVHGFFRHGISIMALCAVLFSLGNLVMSSFFLLVPVIWFYSFFHSNNLNSLPDDEFYSIEDDYFLHINCLFRNRGAIIRRYYRLTAVILISFGASILWNSFRDVIHYIAFELLHLPEGITELIYRLTMDVPSSVVAVIIILAGIQMIRRKKDSLDQN